MQQDQARKLLLGPTLGCQDAKVKDDDGRVGERMDGRDELLGHACVLPVGWTSIVVYEATVQPTGLAEVLLMHIDETVVNPSVHEALQDFGTQSPRSGREVLACLGLPPVRVAEGCNGLPLYPALFALLRRPLAELLARGRQLGVGRRQETRIQGVVEDAAWCNLALAVLAIVAGEGISQLVDAALDLLELLPLFQLDYLPLIPVAPAHRPPTKAILPLAGTEDPLGPACTARTGGLGRPFLALLFGRLCLLRRAFGHSLRVAAAAAFGEVEARRRRWRRRGLGRKMQRQRRRRRGLGRRLGQRQRPARLVPTLRHRCLLSSSQVRRWRLVDLVGRAWDRRRHAGLEEQGEAALGAHAGQT
mmetsp:Transcript_2367/g.9300  ORF Transcript_2367/g.9300 Transcript_2367/m.9300 type:complete len:361 (-) Transcript_2367:155-1237(-)